jgi:hypothetical protein
MVRNGEERREVTEVLAMSIVEGLNSAMKMMAMVICIVTGKMVSMFLFDNSQWRLSKSF